MSAVVVTITVDTAAGVDESASVELDGVVVGDAAAVVVCCTAVVVIAVLESGTAVVVDCTVDSVDGKEVVDRVVGMAVVKLGRVVGNAVVGDAAVVRPVGRDRVTPPFPPSPSLVPVPLAVSCLLWKRSSWPSNSYSHRLPCSPFAADAG